MSSERIPVPFISVQDYETFRGILNHLPPTHDEWLKNFERRSTLGLKAGQDILQIEVHPDEFVRYCNSIRLPHDAASLQKFAEAKAAGNQY